MRLLVTILCISILLVSCVSTQIEDAEGNNTQDQQTNSNTDTDDTTTNNTDNDVVDNDNDNDKTDGTNMTDNSTNNVPVAPPVAQPSISEENLLSSVNIQELIVADGDDDEWEKFREAYIVQYIKDLRLVPAMANKNMSKDVFEYLDKGYGMYWSPISGTEKKVELGLLAARSKNMENLDKHLEVMASQGKGKDYYSLAYIAAWTYVTNGAKDKAASLLQQDNLVTNVPAFGLDVPLQDLQNLQANAQ